MQKIYLGLAAVAITGVVLTGVFFGKTGNQPAPANPVNSAKNGQDQGQTTTNQVNTQAAETINPSGSYSVNELFNMKRPMKCTWKESATGDKDVTNIIYINGKKFYQGVTMGDIGHSYTISNGEYLYIWNDFTDAASKMKYTEAEANAKPGQAQGTAGMDQKRDFVCENWTADDSIFIPPQGKNFKDVTEEMTQSFQDLKDNSGSIKKQACDRCANAPSQELIDACLQNMECDQ